MAMKLTEREIERLVCPEGNRDKLVFDTVQKSLAVRVVTAGSKSYLVQYFIAGRRRRVPLGSVDAISLAAARAAARAATRAILGDKARGGDPATERKAQAERVKAEALRERLTLARLVDDWDRLHLAYRSARYRKDAVGTMKRTLRDWWSRPADRLQRRDVVSVVDSLTPSVARALAAYGSACFGWAQSRGSASDNPFTKLPVAPTNVQRDRVLTDAEAVKVWMAAVENTTPYGPIVCLPLLTGQRRDEVRGMDWSEIALDLLTWTIPGLRTKNRLPSVVPLSAPAQAILRDRLAGRRDQNRGLVFPGEGGAVMFGNWSKCKVSLDRISGVIGWRLHDLRRTVATGLQRLGVRLEVTEAVLNHVSGSRGALSVSISATIGQRKTEWRLTPGRCTSLPQWRAPMLEAR